MNTRILELLKAPETIAAADLKTLENEISKFPYMQSMRAVHLFGIHSFSPEQYASQLSVTAAYTTDKKILYKFINRDSQSALPNIQNREDFADNTAHNQQFIEASDAEDFTKNTIIEEDALANEKTVVDATDQLSFQEIGVLSDDFNVEENGLAENQNASNSIGNQEFTEAADAEDFSKNTIVTEDDLAKEKTVVVATDQLSFQEIGTLSDDFKVEGNSSESNQNKSKSVDSQEFTEAADAGNFSKNTIVDEDDLAKEITVVDATDQLSFQEIGVLSDDFNVEENGLAENQNASNSIGNQGFTEAADAEDFSKDKVVDEDAIELDEKIVDNPADLSFHGIEEFLPNVSLAQNISSQNFVTNENILKESERRKLDKQKEEMQRLIAEVEAKMKSSNKPKAKESEPVTSHGINFIENHDQPVIENVSEDKNSGVASVEDSVQEKKETIVSNLQQSSSTWKPMGVSVPQPDSLLITNTSQKGVVSNQEKPTATPTFATNSENESSHTVKNSGLEEERPVINLSFFDEKVLPSETPAKNTEATALEESNVPKFINTWQNWLKLERSDKPVSTSASETIEKPSSTEEIKAKAIDNFIENEPKISKIKEDAQFVVKEKGDNISHLMTETLAKLYVEQKLYTKAVNAYETLKLKYPEKSEEYDKIISEIKTR